MNEEGEISGVLRPMSCELNKLSRSDGSAMLMQGDTAVIVGIYGPVEGKLQKMMHDKASVETIFSPATGPACVEDRVKETIIKETCEAVLLVMLHPGTAICINIQELQDSGGLLACAINAACLALINAGLSMKFLVAAVTCTIPCDCDSFTIDPNDKDIQEARASFTLVFEGTKKDLVSCYTTGRFSQYELDHVIEVCRNASQHVFNFYRNIVKQYAEKI